MFESFTMPPIIVVFCVFPIAITIRVLSQRHSQKILDDLNGIINDILEASTSNQPLCHTPEFKETQQIHNAVSQLINKYRDSEQQRLNASNYDTLTGLTSAQGIRQELKQILPKLHHNHGWAFFIEITHLQRINCTYGHKVGDAALIHIAENLKSIVPVFIARASDNTFMIVDVLASDNQARIYADTLNQHLSLNLYESTRLLNNPLKIIAVKISGQDLDSVFHRAELAFSSHVLNEMSQTIIYDTVMEHVDKGNYLLTKDLSIALESTDQLDFYYQPIWNLNSCNLQAFECLLRWEHPTMGKISPATFIPLAERSFLINRLTKAALHKACETLQEWREKDFIALRFPFRLSINLTATQFTSESFMDEILAIMRSYKTSPQNICIEITETSLMENQNLASERIQQLKEMGYIVAIDDFGTGYSSLAYLLQLDVDIIKIDQSIIKNIAICQNAQKITEAIIQLGQSMKIQVVAEGVETAAQIAKLQQYKCDAIQGFMTGKPSPAINTHQWLNNPVLTMDIPKTKPLWERCCNE